MKYHLRPIIYIFRSIIISIKIIICEENDQFADFLCNTWTESKSTNNVVYLIQIQKQKHNIYVKEKALLSMIILFCLILSNRYSSYKNLQFNYKDLLLEQYHHSVIKKNEFRIQISRFLFLRIYIEVKSPIQLH